jgi:hypothetical protein
MEGIALKLLIELKLVKIKFEGIPEANVIKNSGQSNTIISDKNFIWLLLLCVLNFFFSDL